MGTRKKLWEKEEEEGMCVAVGMGVSWGSHQRKSNNFSNLKTHTHTLVHVPNTKFYFFTFENMLLEIRYQTHFLHYEHYKHVFSKHFLNHSFHIILNNIT